MILRLRFHTIILLSALMLPMMLHAQAQSDGTLHVMRPSINAEQDAAELCLEFDHPLDLSNRGRILGAIHLQSDGKAVPIAPAAVSLASTLLCVQSLVHRQDYSLTLSDMHGANGEKLTEPYKLSFTVPDRAPSLAFVGDPGSLARFRDSDPVLRVVNVASVELLLYRVTDPAHMAEAYRQRMQTTLAPSESLTFAKDKGQLVWQGGLTLDDSDDDEAANQSIERPVPLRKLAGVLAPGLYFLAARDTVTPVASKIVAADLAPLAAQWFISSNLKIKALNKSDGLYIETENADASAVEKGTRLILFNRDQQNMAEGKSDATGLLFLPLSQDKRADAATILGLTDAGDVDFVDVSAEDGTIPSSRFTLQGLVAGLAVDRPFYPPGAQAYLTLTARNIHDEAVATPGSSIQLLRLDRTLYATLPVPDGKAGLSYISFPAPAINGAWPLVWQQADGKVLAQAVLHVTSNTDAPQLEMTADRVALTEDGGVDLSFKGKTEAGKPAPYISGRVFVHWTEPDTFAGWNDYRFGDGDKTDTPPVPVAAFITDANGAAQVNLNLKPPNGLAPLRMAIITAHADPATGVFDPDALSLPVRPANYIVGVKPLAPDGKFAENSLARFDVIALGGDGKRREVPGLKYQIYEEGRSFAWYQAEGRWTYKQLQQRRRIGGGTIDLKAGGGNIIRWQVTAGSYTLEIANADGASLVRFHFQAGWGLLKPNQAKPADLALAPAQLSVQPGVAAKVKFTLEHPAIVSAVIADDRIRKVIHEMRAPGDNEIAFTPEESWGDHVRIDIEAKQKTENGTGVLEGQIKLPVLHKPKELEIAATVPDHVISGEDLVIPVVISNIAAKQPAFVSVLATLVPAAENANRAPLSVLAPNIETDAGGKASVHIAVPSLSGELHLKIVTSNQNQWGQKELAIPARAAFEADLSPPATMQTNDTARLTLNLGNNSAAPGLYHYSVSATSGLKLLGAADGTIDLAVKGEKTVYFNLQAFEAGAKELKLDLTGPRDFHLTRTWPIAVTAEGWALNTVDKAQIAPQQSWTFPGHGKTRARPRPETILAFISPQPLFDAPRLLGTLIESVPFTTGEMTAWLQATQAWRDVIAKAGILPAGALQAREKEILRRLLVRQKPDGSFPSLPDGDGDLSSTADALLVLGRADDPLAKPAAEAATGWLKQRLSNTWFDESERSARAAAFAALAATDRLDVAGLRYFAETSADKTLPPLAMAQLAAALAKSGDRDKANAWLKTLRDQIGAAPAAFPLAAENPLINARDLVPTLQKFSADLDRNPSHDPAILAPFLRAVWVVNDRAGNWRATINGAEKNQTGVLIAAPSAKMALTIHNPADRPLYVVAGNKTKMPAHAAQEAVVTRHIYQLNGSERMEGELNRGEIYVVKLEGTWPSAGERAQKLFIHDEMGAALRAHGCALDGNTVSADMWAWLKNLSLTPVAACEANGNEINAVLASAGDTWRIAYLAEAARARSFNLSPAVARAFPGGEWSAGYDTRIQIK